MSLKLKMIIGCLVLIAMGLTVVASHPQWRKHFRGHFLSSDRKILAKTEFFMPEEKIHLKVFKIKSGNELSLEIFTSERQDEDFKLFQKITLEEKTDGYFTFQGNATNLAIADIDGDQHPEIMAPTFDDQGVARLSTYKWSSPLHIFQKINP